MHSDSMYPRIIAESAIFGWISFMIVEYFGLKSESIAFAVLILGIYLIFSGRIREFKFMGFEAKLEDIRNKPVDQLTESFEIDPSISAQYMKESMGFLENQIIPELLREPKKIRVLKIVKSRRTWYSREPLQQYLRYSTHVVFLEDNPRLAGFASAYDLMQKLESDSEFVEKIREWDLQEPIRKDMYIVKGISRKQALYLMDKLKVDVIAVVSADLRYEGVIDRETIISQIAEELVATSVKRKTRKISQKRNEKE